jgi:hypothetical protein
MEGHMSVAPFRIRKPEPRGPQLVGAGAAADNLKSWMGRLITLVPSEVVAVYLAGRGYVATWLGVWGLVCFILVVAVRIWGTREPSKGPQWITVLVSAVSYVVWVYAIGGRILEFTLPDPGVASAAVLVWTVVVPIFYKGD